jgi:membrane protease YdiL (CAAX protease family)
LLLLWAGIFPIVFAPLWEELVFRGFLFRGFARLGTIGTIVASSPLFTAMHRCSTARCRSRRWCTSSRSGCGSAGCATAPAPAANYAHHAMFNLPFKLVPTAALLGWAN